jgi:hypothetical protein
VQYPSPEAAKQYLEITKDVATIVGVIAGVAALILTAFNTRLALANTKIALGNAKLAEANSEATMLTNRAKFWLDLRASFSKYDDVHLRLRPGGIWSTGQTPGGPDEWAQVEGYMGLFELCETMLEQDLIDAKTFEEAYAYRLRNIVANEPIRHAKLVVHRDGWTRFIALCERMGIAIA